MTDTVTRPVLPDDAAHAEGPDAGGTDRAERSFSLFTVGVVVAAIGCVAAVSAYSGAVELSVAAAAAFVTFLAAFVIAELCAINVDVRSGIAWTVSFTEIPLAVAILIADFEVVLAAHLLAGVGVLCLRRVSRRLVYNAGVMAIEISVAYAVAALVVAATSGAAPPWLAALLGALSVPVVSTVLAMATVWVLRNRMRLRTGLRFMTRVVVVGLVNSSVGVSGYLIATGVAHGWVLVVIVGLGAGMLLWGYAGLLREQRDLDALSDVSQLLTRTEPGADSLGEVGSDAWRELVERLRDQLAAQRLVLRYRIDGAAVLHTVVAGDALPQPLPSDDPLLLQTRYPRPYRCTESSSDVRDALRARGADEALVAPLRSGSHVLGVLEAHDRVSRWRGFGRSDVQLIATMAAHIATALDNRRLAATLRHDAYHDPLTGLLNRPGIAQAARAPLAAGEPTAVLRVNLDVYATVCDALGYTWADRMIVIAGQRLREVLGGTAAIARLEGASFAVLLHGGGRADVADVARQIRSELSANYPVERLTVEANAVVGYACSDAEGATVPIDIDGLLQRADVAMRAATSPDEIRGYVPSMGQIFLRRFHLVTQFRQAVEAGDVTVHYQPKISLPRRTVLGVEALVRWQHPEFGKVHPDEFVPAIEAAGLVDVLTTFVLDAALARARAWLDDGLRISVAVNLSMRSLGDAEFPTRVAAALEAYGVPAELLTFELTESGVMGDPARMLPILRQLHSLGVVLAVDDFGTGYSSLAYLRQLPVDEVKIDKSFVFGMGTDLGDLAVVRSIVELGHSLGLTVVAEGVEDDLARDELEGMGCDVAQGYLISRPLSEQRLDAWLQARTSRGIDPSRTPVLTLLS